MPTHSTCPEPPCYLNFQIDHHQFKSLVPFFKSSHFPMNNNPNKIPCHCQFNAKHKPLLATKASNNSDDDDDDETETPAKPATKPSSAWKRWVVGLMLSIILPSYRHKWAPLMMLKSKVDMTMETVEFVVEVGEELAEGVEKVADEIGDKLPEDTKFKEAVELIENQAKVAVKVINKAEELVHKVVEFQKKLESELIDQAKSENPK